MIDERLETTGLSDDPVFSTDIYRRPLIRNYSHGIGIDPEDVLAAFDMAEQGEYDGFLATKYVDPDWTPEKKTTKVSAVRDDAAEVMDKWFPTTQTPSKKSSNNVIGDPPSAIPNKKDKRSSTSKVKTKSNPPSKPQGAELEAETSKASPKSPLKQSSRDLSSESKTKSPGMEKSPQAAEQERQQSHQHLKPDPTKSRRRNYEPPLESTEMPSEKPKKGFLRYLFPVAAVLAGLAIGIAFGPGIVSKFSAKQPVTIKYADSATFDEMPDLMKGVVETAPGEKTFVIIAIRKGAMARNDQFGYTLRTTTDGQLYSVNGTGSISPDRNRLSIGDYGWGSIRKSPGGQFAIISVNDADYPKWELTGK